MGTFKSSKRIEQQTWLVQSKLLVNLLEERLPGNNWPPRLPENLPLQLEEGKNPIVIVPVLSPFVKLGVTKSQLNCLSASCPSNVLWEKSLKISKLISGFKVQPSALSRRPVRL